MRKAGYYWVKLYRDSDWEIAFYSYYGTDEWNIMFDFDDYIDSEFYDINEEQIIRNV